MDRYETLHTIRDAWLSDRPAMQSHNADIRSTMRLLSIEVSEAIEAITNEDVAELRRELADIGWFLLSAMQIAGGDLYTEMMEKQAYNLLRYRPRDFKENYEQGRLKTKELEKQFQMKEEFYEEVA